MWFITDAESVECSAKRKRENKLRNNLQTKHKFQGSSHPRTDDAIYSDLEHMSLGVISSRSARTLKVSTYFCNKTEYFNSSRKSFSVSVIFCTWLFDVFALLLCLWDFVEGANIKFHYNAIIQFARVGILMRWSTFSLFYDFSGLPPSCTLEFMERAWKI